ncbi:MAG: phage baseplate upper protein, partial [Clostridia bacterium]|nr:phage baseplate upper protein [Clostridia bacterium]
MIKHELTLDVATYNGKGVFRAKQGDQNSHELDIAIVNGGDALDLADVETVVLNIKRADEIASQFYGETDGDTVKIVLPHFALAVAGETKMSVSLISGNSVLTTLTFTIMVEGQEVTDADVSSDGTENVLCALLCEVKDALTELDGMKETAARSKEALENSEKALAETKELSDDLTARVEEDERVVGTMDGRMDTLEKTVQVVLGKDYGDLPSKLHSLDEDRKKVNETLYAEDTGLCDRTEVLEESLQAEKKARADADEKLDARVKAIEDDYLTSTDKKAIEGDIS